MMQQRRLRLVLSATLGIVTEVFVGVIPALLLIRYHVPDEALPLTMPLLISQLPSVLIVFALDGIQSPHWVLVVEVFAVPILQSAIFAFLWLRLLTRSKRKVAEVA
jgi:hypothetical protein